MFAILTARAVGRVPDWGVPAPAPPLPRAELLQDQRGGRRGPDLDRVRLRLRVDRELHGDLHPLEGLRPVVDRLHDLPDVPPPRAQAGAEGRGGGRPPAPPPPAQGLGALLLLPPPP